ncbi:hypothetical protein AAT19DRAFT_11774 [Rhodotorula toruloides]|uniref:Uncharacterized protein n=1 Tax=Rhodotorula toruloides TaxID=5286 RepID=A0A2S9ZVH9_RHOTO|nr:hypothetical protein AAT19DRAFT_11774 [Rhodotorula toruloides]
MAGSSRRAGSMESARENSHSPHTALAPSLARTAASDYARPYRVDYHPFSHPRATLQTRNPTPSRQPSSGPRVPHACRGLCTIELEFLYALDNQEEPLGTPASVQPDPTSVCLSPSSTLS